MSIRIEAKEEDIEISEDGKELEIFLGDNPNGNMYVDLPIDLIKKILEKKKNRGLQAMFWSSN